MPAAALILNADDLGLGPTVDRGILAAWEAGAVSDSTAFANAPDLPEVLARARAAGLPVGVHLNLTFGKPLSDPAEIPALVTPEGTFLKRMQWQLPLPVAQVRLELGRQVERFAGLLQPSHLDSHHHVHRYPEILDVVIALARERALPVRAINVEMHTTLRAAGIATPDHFSMDFYAEQATVKTLIRLTEECPGGVLEIMTHPGYVGAGLPSSYRVERAQELAALMDARWLDYVQDRDLPLISFGSLKH